MKRIWTVVATLVLASALVTAAQASNKVQIDASMLVTGTVTISKKGLVAGYQLDHPDKLPKVVVDLLSRYIPRFRFKPVIRHGEAVAGIASMTLRVVARQTGKDRYSVSVAGFQFGSTNTAYSLQYKHRSIPHFPNVENWDGVGGIVYLLLQVNREGRVMHVYAQQVNLTETPRDPRFIRRDSMRRWRNDFAHAAVGAVRKWTFKIPTKGPSASLPYWYARVPVEFGRIGIPSITHHGYGQWVSYVPGPRKPVPWLKHMYFASGSVDAQVPGTVHTVNPQLQLVAQPKKS